MEPTVGIEPRHAAAVWLRHIDRAVARHRHADRIGEQSTVEFIRKTVRDQYGMAMFATRHTSGLRRTYRLRDALQDRHDVLISKDDPESEFSYQRYKYARFRIEILVRALDHSSLANRSQSIDNLSATKDRPASIEVDNG